MVVRPGVTSDAISMSSNPVMEISSGTLMPSAWHSAIAPIARISLPQTIAVVRGHFAVISRRPSRPAASVNGFSTTLNVAVSGVGGLTKSGAGTLTTTGTNSYTGDTVVTAGTLSVAGANLDDASSVTVASGGAKLDLAFVGNDNIASLTLGATTYTSNASGPFDAATYPAFLSGSGVLVVGGAAPTFASWAAGLGLSGDPDSDFENDGVADGVEYVLGTDPKVSSSTGITTTQAGTDMTFAFSRDDQSETADLTLIVEAGPDFQSWPQVFQIGDTTANSSAGVVITENGAGADTVVVTIPKGSAVKFFARMKVVVIGS